MSFMGEWKKLADSMKSSQLMRCIQSLQKDKLWNNNNNNKKAKMYSKIEHIQMDLINSY